MNLKLKICGMRDPDNILEVCKLHPDFIGFIFYSRSPRYLSDDFVLPKIDSAIRKTGVFVNEYFEKIMSLVKLHSLDFVQLHGEESFTLCKRFKSEGVGVIKVFSVDEAFNFRVTEAYENSVDFFVFDTRGKNHGGNGVTFNWSLLNRYNQKIPFFLSGGLSPENIHDVDKLQHMNLYGIDVNSGFEIQPALKDVEKLKQLSEMLKTTV
jgi:phosphoribosylanthranilate isomerase